MPDQREARLQPIRSNIDRYGQHVYMVLGASYPRFSYSIGLSPRVGFELIIGGSAYYSNDQVVQAINESADKLTKLGSGVPVEKVTTEIGDFSIRDAHPSWAGELALGAFDYYDNDEVRIRQLVPSAEAWTIDVPDMSEPWDAERQPVWRWLYQPWPFQVAENSTVVTNHRAMRGEAVTEGLRRGEKRWELFVDADPDVPQKAVYVIPFSTLLGFDSTLEAFVQLPVGAGLKRETGGAIGPWTRCTS
jgi:hypothetical protein